MNKIALATHDIINRISTELEVETFLPIGPRLVFVTAAVTLAALNN